MVAPRSIFFCVLLSFALLVLADNPYPYDINGSRVTGTAGNNTIFYQQDNFFTLNRVRNPVRLQIAYSNGYNYNAGVCVNSNFNSLPISGSNLEVTCPSGAYGVVSNNVMVDGTEFDNKDDPDGAVDTTVSVDLYLRPSAPGNAGYVVVLPDSDTAPQNFQVSFDGSQCDAPYYPVGSNGQCITIDELEDQTVVSLGAASWAYFTISVNSFATTPNNVTVSVNGTDHDISMYMQNGYYPTADWHMNTINNNDDKDITHATVLTPSANDVLFLGLYNANSEASTVSVSLTVNDCKSNEIFGYSCMYNSSLTSPITGIMPFSATVSNNNGTNGQNNGTALAFDYSDDDYDSEYAYFKIVDYPEFADNSEYFVRVTVANNDVSALNGAPPVFASLGSVPSAQAHQYNMSTNGDVAHQLSLPVTTIMQNEKDQSKENTWFVAVQLPVDFSIWVGVNCANNCSSGDHGTCMCGDQTCMHLTSNFTANFDMFYTLSTSLLDSAGACTCDNNKYDYSYDCTEKNNGNSALYVLLVAIAGLLILLVAIAVPIYCWRANKKAKGYSEMM